MLNQLFNHSTGFAWGVRAAAFLNLGMLVLSGFLMKTRPITKRDTVDLDTKVVLVRVLKDLPFMLALGRSVIFDNNIAVENEVLTSPQCILDLHGALVSMYGHRQLSSSDGSLIFTPIPRFLPTTLCGSPWKLLADICILHGM